MEPWQGIACWLDPGAGVCGVGCEAGVYNLVGRYQVKALVILCLGLAGCQPTPKDCPAILHEAAITQRAAEICTTQLVGCSLSYQEVRAVVSEVEAARVCK